MSSRLGGILLLGCSCFVKILQLNSADGVDGKLQPWPFNYEYFLLIVSFSLVVVMEEGTVIFLLFSRGKLFRLVWLDYSRLCISYYHNKDENHHNTHSLCAKLQKKIWMANWPIEVPGKQTLSLTVIGHHQWCQNKYI